MSFRKSITLLAVSAPLLTACDAPVSATYQNVGAWTQRGSCAKSTFLVPQDAEGKQDLNAQPTAFSCKSATVRMDRDMSSADVAYKEGYVTFDTSLGDIKLWFPVATWSDDNFSMDVYQLDAPDLMKAVSSGGEGKCSGVWDKKTLAIRCDVETGIETLHLNFIPAKGLDYTSG